MVAIDFSEQSLADHFTNPSKQLRHAEPEPIRANSLISPLYLNAWPKHSAKHAKPLAEDARPHAFE